MFSHKGGPRGPGMIPEAILPLFLPIIQLDLGISQCRVPSLKAGRVTLKTDSITFQLQGAGRSVRPLPKAVPIWNHLRQRNMCWHRVRPAWTTLHSSARSKPPTTWRSALIRYPTIIADWLLPMRHEGSSALSKHPSDAPAEVFFGVLFTSLGVLAWWTQREVDCKPWQAFPPWRRWLSICWLRTLWWRLVKPHSAIPISTQMLALTILSLNLYLIFCEVGIMHVLMYIKFRAVYMKIHRLPCTNASSHSLLFDWEKSCIEPSSAKDDVGRRTSSLLLSRSNYSQRHASSSAAAPLQESRAYSSYSSSALALVLMVPLVLARLAVLELHNRRKGRSRGRERMAY